MVNSERKCPNCGKEGLPNYYDNGTDVAEWDCANRNCRVSLFQVPKNGAGDVEMADNERDP